MESVHPEAQMVYRVEVVRVVRPSWLFVPMNFVGGMGRSRYRSLPRSARVEANLEGINTIS